MVGINWRRFTARKLFVPLLVILLSIGLGSCGDRPAPSLKAGDSPAKLAGKISEVAPPEAIQDLRQVLEAYQPQVSILSPRPDQVLQDDQVSVQFRVQDLPLFKNEDLGLGPHLHVFLDDQPYIAVYDSSKPLEFKDLTPGTHTIRAFASRPWHESFKNEGAYAQTTFHVFTKTPYHSPDVAQPLLTYSRPQGSYGAEPIMLDFYLNNAPLHLVARENPDDDIADWRIRCTVNGEGFVLDRWEPIYLKGFKPGKNWVQLEFLDENGNSVVNAFNNTVRIVNYEPNGKDALSKLVRGDLAASKARGIVDLNYEPEPAVSEPTPRPELTPIPEPVPTPEPAPTIAPEVPAVEAVPAPEVEAAPTPAEPARDEAFHNPELPIAPPIEPEAAEPNPLLVPSEATPPQDKESAPQRQPKGFFNRFRRRAAEPTDLPPPRTLPEVIDAPTLDSIEPELKADPEPIAPPEAESQPVEPSAPVEPLPSLMEAPRLEPIAPAISDPDRSAVAEPETPTVLQRPVVE